MSQIILIATNFRKQLFYSGLLLLLNFIFGTLSLLADSESSSLKNSPVNTSSIKTSPDKTNTIEPNQNNQDLKKAIVLQDLAYGNILFEYYRGNSIEALNQILIAEKQQKLPNHYQNAKLLSGVIYLDLGMIVHAQKIFTELLTEDNLKSELLSRLEFYLAKILYRQADYPRAQSKLLKVVEHLEIRLKDEALIMLSNIAVKFNQKQEARTYLKDVSQDTMLAVYSRYNLGLSFLREEKLNEALDVLNPLFNQVWTINTTTEKSEDTSKIFYSLQDKAKLAIGYYYLSLKEYDKARQSLLSIRLNSLESNKALLGMGWSYFGEGDNTKALSHWIALANRDKRDIAVQEVLLAIPYIYKQLDSQQQALDGYIEASNTYQQQLELINKVILEINTNQFIENKLINVISHNQLKSSLLGINDSQLLGEDLAYYLFELMSQNQFNESVIGFQQLELLVDMLNYWQKQLPMFNQMLLTNQKRFAEKMPLVDEYLTKDMTDDFQNELNMLEQDIVDIKSNKKLYLLADKNDLALHQRINSLFEKLSSLPENMINESQKIKAQRAKGVLDWQLQLNRTDKTWQLEKEAKQIKNILSELSIRKNNLANARMNAENRFSGFQQKIDVDTNKLITLETRLKSEISNQLNQIKQNILMVLTKRKQLLENYILQSDLEIARINAQSILMPELD